MYDDDDSQFDINDVVVGMISSNSGYGKLHDNSNSNNDNCRDRNDSSNKDDINVSEDNIDIM